MIQDAISLALASSISFLSISLLVITTIPVDLIVLLKQTKFYIPRQVKKKIAYETCTAHAKCIPPKCTALKYAHRKVIDSGNFATQTLSLRLWNMHEPRLVFQELVPPRFCSSAIYHTLGFFHSHFTVSWRVLLFSSAQCDVKPSLIRDHSIDFQAH